MPRIRGILTFVVIAVGVLLSSTTIKADDASTATNLQHQQASVAEDEHMVKVESWSSPEDALEEASLVADDVGSKSQPEGSSETAKGRQADEAADEKEKAGAAETKEDLEIKDEPVVHTKQEESNNASSGEATAQGSKQRLWGSPTPATHAASASASTSGSSSSKDGEDSTDTKASSPKTSGQENTTRVQIGAGNSIPFVPGKPPSSVGSSTNHHSPPAGFTLSARVYIDPDDSLAHFDENPQRITLPYWDCGVTGATTSPLPLKNAYFRHALASTSTSWSGTDGKHPVLAVALTPLILELNSGEKQTLQSGQVFLLEDVLLSGHRMNPVSGDLKVLFLTLPQQHYHTGKHHLSLKLPRKGTLQDPCPDLPATSTEATTHQDSFRAASALPLSEPLVVVDSSLGRRIRLAILASIGMSLSTLAADFLGKTAPLWLAVGIGGTCFVAGSTYALTIGGDRLLTAIELWQEQRRLQPSSGRQQQRPRRRTDAADVSDSGVDTTATMNNTPIPPLEDQPEVHAM